MNFFLVGVLSFFSLFSWAQRYKLELQLQKGSSYSQFIDADVSSIVKADNKDVYTDMGMKGLMTFEVVDIIDSVFLLEAYYESIEWTMDLPNKSLKFSSENEKADDVVSMLFEAITYNPFELKLSKTGKVLEIKNLDSVIYAALDEFELGQTEREAFYKQLHENFNESSLKSSIELATAIFPNAPVAIGDKWAKQTTLKSLVPLKVTMVYELKEVTPTQFVIHGSAKIQTVDKDATVEMAGMYMSYNLQGSLINELTVDRSTGWTKKGESRQVMKGSSTIKENPKSSQKMTVPIQVFSNTSISDKP
jgi:hypothetical protein